MRIAADGSQTFHRTAQPTPGSQQCGSVDSPQFEAKFTQGTLPNGLAFAANGDILISNFGTDLLEVMTRDGDTRTLFDRIDGLPIGKVNFVLRDSHATGSGSRCRPASTRGRRPPPAACVTAYLAVVEPGTASGWWPTGFLLHQRDPAGCTRAVAVHRRDHRPVDHPHAAG
jgi:hypothetical protein